MRALTRVFSKIDNLPHGFQIGGTVVAAAALFFFSWYFATQGWLEQAATALAFFLMQVTRMSAVSLKATTERSETFREFRRTAGFIDTLRAEYAEWERSHRTLAHCLLAIVYTGVFLAGRKIAATFMTLIASPLLAVAIGLAIAAVVISPPLFRALADTFKNHRDDEQADNEVGDREHP